MTIKEKVRQRKKLFGTHINLTDPAVTEILGSLGYDFLFIDMEHTVMSCEHVYNHLLAAKSVGIPSFVRVPADDLTTTKKILEMGPEGIIFPMVKNAEHAKQLIDWTLYPPFGKRGCGPRRAVRYGLENEELFYREKHLELCRFVQIELKSAAEDAENIAAIPGVDGCIIGMHDLSGSINRLGDVFCEENLELAKKSIAAFHAAKKPIGTATFATDTATLKRYLDMGLDIISTGAEYDYILKHGIKTLENIKEVKEK